MRGVVRSDIPKDVYVGKVSTQWPLLIFEHEVHAMHWLDTPSEGGKKHLYRCRLDVREEVVLHKPKPYLGPSSEDIYEEEE